MLGRPRLTLAAAAAILVLAVLAVTQLRPVASSTLLVGSHSAAARAGAALDRTFGQEPIVVSVGGDVRQILQPATLLRLLALEGRMARLPGVRAVYGPATFINQAVIQTGRVVDGQLGALTRAARRATTPAERHRIVAQRARQFRDLLVRFGSIGPPALDNAGFVRTLIFGSGVEPKKRWQWLFPDAHHAVVLVRAAPGVDGDRAIALGTRLRRLVSQAKLPGVRLRIAGYPLLAAALERETRLDILHLAPVAVAAMVVLLLVVLRRRRGRILALALALVSALVALGVTWPLGLGLTVATVAAMPVLLGLGLDFAVQLQTRYWLERRRGLEPRAAAASARRHVGPTLVLAALAMSTGFLVLLVSASPLIQRLGCLLALGTVCAVAAALVLGPVLLMLRGGGPVAPLELPVPSRWRRMRLPPAALGAVVGLGILGLTLSGRTPIETDVSLLGSKDMAELRDVRALQHDLGTSGQVSVAIQARDVTDPAVLRWMARFGARAARVDSRLRPGPNLADLATGGDPSAKLSRASVDGVLRLLPPYFLDAVVSRDRRLAELTFGVPFVSVARQGHLVDGIEAAAADPPRGVRVATTGIVAEAAQSARALGGTRPGLLLISALVIAAILLAVWRRVDRVLLALGPALVACGGCALAVAVLGIRLSPLGAVLEPLVLAVGLEFGMLLEMRFRQVRAEGLSPQEAQYEATRQIGGAVALSAATVALGFLVLSFSRLPVLAQLGWLVAFELVVCLVVTLLVVPSLAARLDTRRARSSAPVPLTHLRSTEG
ncbi:MAG: uncharacterized protein QOF76_5498 [Solirubrobacteraceae bacterium]|jgi:predicted RND superfamily exporter protein|nr:uncharacterized protein [Solirubrobacteraceae bacterium]